MSKILAIFFKICTCFGFGIIAGLLIPPPILLPVASKEGGAMVDFEKSAGIIEAYCQRLRDFTGSNLMPTLDFRAGVDWTNRELYLDGIHQSPKGHQQMAASVIAFLKKQSLQS